MKAPLGMKTTASPNQQRAPREEAIRHLPLSEPMFLILLTLSQEDLHGYGILQAIGKKSAGHKTLRTGTLYNALGRLQKQELITDSDQEPAKDSDSRRRTYCLTELGQAVLEAESQRLTTLVDMMYDKQSVLAKES